MCLPCPAHPRPRPGDAFKGCRLIAAAGSRRGERQCEPDRWPAVYPKCQEGRRWRPPAPVTVRAALWAARATQGGRGCKHRERGRGSKRGRLPREERGCVCGREGRPGASCFLSASDATEGAGRDGGGLPGHQAGQFKGLACVSLSVVFSPLSPTPEEGNSGENFYLSGLVELTFFFFT